MVNDTQSPVATSNAFSFISKSWREVRVSANADFQLIRNRANSFKNLANSFDRELENFINSASGTFSVPAIPYHPPAEIDFVKKLQPKLSEFRRTYSAPDFSKRVLEKWGARRGTIKIDLSAIKNAIVSEVEDEEREGVLEFKRGRGRRRRRRFRFKEEKEEEEERDFWEPIRELRTRIKEFESRRRRRRSSISMSEAAAEIFEGWKGGDFVEKFKSSLVGFC